MTMLNLPDGLREKFEHKARELYGEHGAETALSEAVTQWLAHTDLQTIAAEREMNNRAYREMKIQLERQYAGRCVMIAQGKVQAVGDSFEELADSAPTAHHRLAIRVGATTPKRTERLWRVQPH